MLKPAMTMRRMLRGRQWQQDRQLSRAGYNKEEDALLKRMRRTIGYARASDELEEDIAQGLVAMMRRTRRR